MTEDDLTTPEQREALMVAERKTRKEVERKNQVLKTLTVEYVDVDAIKPNPWNPNRQSEHDFELLLRSMEEDGFTQPIVCVRLGADDFEDEKIRDAGYLKIGDVMVVDGEHRWRAARRLGFKEVPVAIAPMTAIQARVSTLRHNRARGSEDLILAADVLRDLEALGALAWAADSLLLDDVELERILEDVPAPQALADPEQSEAWRPDKGSDAGGDEVTVEGQTGTARSGEWQKAGSAAAVDAIRERERRMAEAHTEEQKEMIRQDSQREFHRVSLIFHGEEARIVKQVLGGAPAEAVVQLCRREAGELNEALEKGWVTLDSVLGARAIPAEAAKVLREAIKRMEDEGAIGEHNRFQVIEYLAADYLGGA